MLPGRQNGPCQEGGAADPPTDTAMANRSTKRGARYSIPDCAAQTSTFVDFGLANCDSADRFRRLLRVGREFLKVFVVRALARKRVVEEKPGNFTFHARVIGWRRKFGTIETAYIADDVELTANETINGISIQAGKNITLTANADLGTGCLGGVDGLFAWRYRLVL